MRVYATSNYNDNKIELLSRFYLQTHTKINQKGCLDDFERNYELIYNLHYAITGFQTVLMPFFSLIGGGVFSLQKRY